MSLSDNFRRSYSNLRSDEELGGNNMEEKVISEILGGIAHGSSNQPIQQQQQPIDPSAPPGAAAVRPALSLHPRCPPGR